MSPQPAPAKAGGTGALLGKLVERDIEPHIPVWDQSEVAANGKFTRADFAFDKDKNVYLCPNGKELRTSGTAHGGTTLKYVARKSDCASCPLKPNCTRGSERHVSRDVNEEARDYTRALMMTEKYRVSARQRKIIETGFGDLKRNLGLTRLRLRGLMSVLGPLWPWDRTYKQADAGAWPVRVEPFGRSVSLRSCRLES